MPWPTMTRLGCLSRSHGRGVPCGRPGLLITTAHLLALHELGASEAVGHAVRTLTEGDPQEHICRVLELQGLVLLEAPWSYRLTYAGREALGFLEAMRSDSH